MKKKYTFVFLVIVQISIIGFLFQKIIYKKDILETVSINPIQKETLLSSPSGDLRYFYEPLPNTIIKPKVIFKGLENISYTINNESLNQKENYPVKKTKYTYRIVTLGDSHTFGQNVNTDENYPSQLNKILNDILSCPTIKKFEVLNLGVPGYDFQYTIERFRLHGQKYNPDLIIWLFVPDDFGRILETMVPILVENTKKIKTPTDYKSNLIKGLYYTPWKEAKTKSMNELGGEDAILKLQKIYLREISMYYSGPLILTYYPIMPTKYREILNNFQDERKYTYITNELPHIYKINNAQLPDGHPSQYGYQLIATHIFTYLLKQKMFDCSIK